MANYYLDLPLRSVGTLTAPGLASTANQALEIAELEAINANTTSMKIIIDGVVYSVLKDTVFPSNTISVPVEITGASGPINITAGDLNVQLSDQGPNADVTRIGDGTNQLGITAINEAKVFDEQMYDFMSGNMLPSTQQIEANTLAIADKIALMAGLTDSQPVVGPLTDAELRATPLAVSGTFTSSGLTDAELRATPVEVDTGLDLASLNLEATQLLIKAKTDNLDVALSTIAKEATLLAQSEKLPASLGAKTSALSLSVTPSTDAVFNTQSTPASIAGTVTTTQKTVGLTAVRATVSGSAPDVARKKLWIKPSESNTGKIYIGASGATIANAMEIIGPDRLEFEFDSGDYYLISNAAAQVVEILEKI